MSPVEQRNDPAERGWQLPQRTKQVHGGFLSHKGTPKSSHLSEIFPYKPTIVGVYFRKRPNIANKDFSVCGRATNEIARNSGLSGTEP